MKCPKCKHVQQRTDECELCGIIFAKYYSFLLKKKFDRAVQKYHAQEFDAALEIFNAIVGAKIPKDTRIVRECKKYISLIGDDALLGAMPGPEKEPASEFQGPSINPDAKTDAERSYKKIKTIDSIHSSAPANLLKMNSKFKYIDIILRIIAFISLIPLFLMALFIGAMASGGPGAGILPGLMILSIASLLILFILFSILKPEILSKPFSKLGKISYAIGRSPAYIYALIGLYLDIKVIIEPIYCRFIEPVIKSSLNFN